MNLFYNKEQEEDVINKLAKSISLQTNTILKNEELYQTFTNRKIKNEEDVRRIMNGRGIHEYIREELEQPLSYILANQPFLYGLSRADSYDKKNKYINTVTIYPTSNSFVKDNVYEHDSEHIYTMFRTNIWDEDEDTEESDITLKDIKLDTDWMPVCWTRGFENNLYSDFNTEGRNGYLMQKTIRQRLEYAYNNTDKLLVKNAYLKIQNIINFYELFDENIDSSDGWCNSKYIILSGWAFAHRRFDNQPLLQQMSQKYVDSVLQL